MPACPAVCSLVSFVHTFNDTVVVGVKWVGAFNPISNVNEVKKILASWQS